jgi:hypothetical protein
MIQGEGLDLVPVKLFAILIQLSPKLDRSNRRFEVEPGHAKHHSCVDQT